MIDPIADLDTLRASQLGKCAGLLALVAKRGARPVPEVTGHYRLLTAVQAAHPEAVAGLLRHPQVSAWAARCLRLLDAGADASADLAYAGCVAAAAAIRARYPCAVPVRLRSGALALPTLGRALLGDGDGPAVVIVVPDDARHLATITADTARVAVPADPYRDAPGWEGLRRLTAGSRDRFLEDLDPYRGYGRLAVTGRVDPPTAERWQEALTAAWRLLGEHHPGYAAALDAAWNSLVPLDLRPGEKHVSADSADAFGAIAVSGPPDPTTLAMSLVHEFQHAKLNALHDLDPLFDPGGTPRFYAPWRPDPRPVGALLHGVYAHLGVTDFWRVHRRVATGNERHIAEVEFARWLTQTLEAAQFLAGCDELTPAGTRFLAAATDRLTGWLGEPVSARSAEVAALAALDHRACWRLRNLAAEEDDVRRLAAAWRAGRAATGPVRVRLAPRPGRRNTRPDLLYQRLRDPEGFARETRGREGDPDMAYARGDHGAAADGYRARLAANAHDRHAWTGLGLTGDRTSALLHRPEVVYALYHELVGPSPEELADWLHGWDHVAGDSMLHSPRTPTVRPATTSGWSAPSTSS